MMGPELFGQVISRATQRQDAEAQVACAYELANQIADAAGLCPEQTFDALTFIPDNMLSLLNSPEGWAALAQFVAADLGVQGLNYRPQVH